MAVNTQHKEYTKYFPEWQRMRDVLAGEMEIKSKDEGKAVEYLPPLTGHMTASGEEVNTKYNVYIKYANWYEATGRTLDGMIGLVFRKVPSVSLGPNLEDIEKDINLQGDDLLTFSQKTFSEVSGLGRVGILIDLPQAEEGLTKQQIEDLNVRPYAVMYKTESIINWKKSNVNNKNQLTLVVLKEIVNGKGSDEFETVPLTTYRVLDLIQRIDDKTGLSRLVYRQRVFEEKKNGQGEIAWVVTSTSFPIVNGDYLDYIPFIPISDDDLDIDPDRPHLSGIATLNIGHYRNSANFENGLIWTGNPTPWVAGFLDNGSEEINLGSTEALRLEQGGSAGYMEFTGQGLKPIQEAMDQKENMMAVLGSRILAPEKKAAEAAETESIRRAGEQGILATIANNVSNGLTMALRIMSEWKSGNKDTESAIVLNTDFMPVMLDSATMISLLQMYQAKIISLDVFRWNLRQGEVIPNALADETIDKQIEENPPPDLNDGSGEGMFNDIEQPEAPEDVD